MLQNQCFAIPVLNRYSTRNSEPRCRVKRSFGTIKWRNPLLRQIEQLHSTTSISLGAKTANLTRPQWHPPAYSISAGSSAVGSTKLRSRFHLRGVTTAPCRAVHFRPVVKYALRGSDVAGFALPGFQCRILQGARIGKTHLPRMRAEFVHCVEMLCGAHRALAA